MGPVAVNLNETRVVRDVNDPKRGAHPGHIPLTQRPSRPGNGPKQNGRHRYTPSRAAVGWGGHRQVQQPALISQPPKIGTGAERSEEPPRRATTYRRINQDVIHTVTGVGPIVYQDYTSGPRTDIRRAAPEIRWRIIAREPRNPPRGAKTA